jgi:eukaryotic-like serine/threonine-protein kinase
MGNTPASPIATPSSWSAPASSGLRLQRVLGSGGMATVYEASERSGRKVAVKLLHARLAASEHYRRLLMREAQVTRTITHPGVVRVLRLMLPAGAAPYLVLELLEGHSVGLLAGSPARASSARDVAELAAQLLDVLQATHDQGVIHHDVKPDNLFLTCSGQLKLLDFGIASLRGELAHNLRGLHATTLGTPAFMAHEQARGRWDEVDQRSDLWSVGATMFALLTGESVHAAESRDEQLARAMSVPARPIGSVRPDLPAAFAEVIDRALAFEREQRWPDARSMSGALRGAMAALAGSQPRRRHAARAAFSSSAVRSVPWRCGSHSTLA